MSITDSPLGKPSAFPKKYSPELLCAICRSDSRREIGIVSDLPFSGFDLWRCYELSWLDLQDKPHVGILELRVPCESENLVESKSLKLYLGSFHSTRFRDADGLSKTIQQDLEKLLKDNSLSIRIIAVDSAEYAPAQLLSGECIDSASCQTLSNAPSAELLRPKSSTRETREEILYSHLFRSLCPVTGQPDWATVVIEYKGAAIEHTALLSYLASYREHPGFHEDCCERIFLDIHKALAPEKLSVACSFTRRGGIDISPIRYTPGFSASLPVRVIRQ